MKHLQSLVALGFASAWFLPSGHAADQLLSRLAYHHPSLVADVGVGLWAWPLPMDFDDDGLMDLVVVCPDRPSNGIYFFRNTGNVLPGTGLPRFEPARRIGKTTHAGWNNGPSPAVSIIDGRPIVTTTGAMHPDFVRSAFERPVTLGDHLKIHPGEGRVRANQWKFADYDGDGRPDIVVGIDYWGDYGWDNAWDEHGRWKNGPLRGYVYVLRDVGAGTERRYGPPDLVRTTDGKPVEVFGMPSPCFGDFRGTGKLDLICGEFLDGLTFFENVGSRTAPRYAPGRRLTVSGRPLHLDLCMITPIAVDFDGDGDLDLVVGEEDGRVAFIENTGRLDAHGAPQFLPPRHFQQEADELKCGALATPVGVDWDGDGAMDIISGNTAGYVVFFQNLSAPGVEKPKWATPKYLEADGKVIRFMAGANGSIQGPAEAKWGYTTLSVADWDGDGLRDLVVNSILGKVVWFKNTGTRTEPKLAAAQPIEVEWEGVQPLLAWGWMRPEGKALLTQWRTTPFAVDWDRDGLTDLVMLDHEGYLALFLRARRDGKLVLLPPKRVLCDEHGESLKLSGGAAGRSGRRKVCITDWDGDGKLDILLNSTSANFLRQVDARDGKWIFKDMGALVQQNIEGHDVSPTVVDFNGDGVPDFLGGAEDGRLYYLRNPRTR